MSTIKAANLQNTGSGAPTIKNSSGTEVGQFAKAWINFNGTGTVAIRDDFNVSSITDQATGRYTVNLTNAMGSAENYVITGASGEGAGKDVVLFDSGGATYVAPTSTSFRVRIADTTGLHQDARHIMLAIFGA